MAANVPNLVVAGVNKAGTTSLFSALARHPDVGTSDVKETCFFLPLRYDEPMPPTAQYERHFAAAGDRPVLMEATPGYFYGGDRIAPVLADLRDDLQVVVVLREPVSRLLSFFRFKQAMLELPEALTADEYVEQCLQHPREELVRRRELNPWFGVEGGCYDRYLPPWQETFGDRLTVLFFDDLAADSERVVRDLGDRLGLDRSGWPEAPADQQNKTIAPKRRNLHRLAIRTNEALERPLRRHPKIKRAIRSVYGRVNAGDATADLSADGRAALEALYAPRNEALAALLGDRPVPEWLRR